jgi:hypothetical protein
MYLDVHFIVQAECSWTRKNAYFPRTPTPFPPAELHVLHKSGWPLRQAVAAVVVAGGSAAAQL